MLSVINYILYDIEKINICILNIVNSFFKWNLNVIVKI